MTVQGWHFLINCWSKIPVFPLLKFQFFRTLKCFVLVIDFFFKKKIGYNCISEFLRLHCVVARKRNSINRIIRNNDTFRRTLPVSRKSNRNPTVVEQSKVFTYERFSRFCRAFCVFLRRFRRTLNMDKPIGNARDNIRKCWRKCWVRQLTIVRLDGQINYYR